MYSSFHTVPPTIHGLPSHLSPIEGKGACIEAKVEGHPPPTLAWYHDGEVVVADYSIEINEQGSLFFPGIELKHSGVYKLVATNDSGKAEKEVSVSVMSEGCDSGEDGGSGETNRPVPVSEFGIFVSEHHSHGNKKFRESYEVGRPALMIYFCIKYGIFVHAEPTQWRSRSYVHCLTES